MNEKKRQVTSMMLVGVIIVVTLFYAFELQPVATGNQDMSIFQYTRVLDVLLSRAPTVWSSLFNGNNHELKTFSSYGELITFLAQQYHGHSRGWYCLEDSAGVGMTAPQASMKNEAGVSAFYGSLDYSQTNVQVVGVDEPDIVKTDGAYLYIVANSKICIVKSFPAVNATILSTLSLSDMNPSEIFIDGDRLIVFGSSYTSSESNPKCGTGWWPSYSTTVVRLYDLSDRENPELLKDIEIDGGYFDARMIGDYVYIIATQSTYQIYQENGENATINMPCITVDDVTREIPADSIYYVDIPQQTDAMTHVMSLNILSTETSQKSLLLGGSHTMYVSRGNIFLAHTAYGYSPLWEDGSGWQTEETTILHKITINDGDINSTAQGEVPGRILNQFSMDEHKGYLRIATTRGSVWGGDSSNNVYILDENLDRVSEIENIAPGERIYSARFMGDKAYLVTFKKVDPFFTLDLSDPHNPQVLGELKIPGYSDYLHPFDENHIIGIGKDTVEALDEEKGSRGLDFAWYQGIKIALFDVSDFENPKEVAKVIIGDRGTSSPALYDHKAFLFDREKEILVIPVSLYEIPESVKQQHEGYTGNLHGEFTFQGAYVYRLNEEGFDFKGRIAHSDSAWSPSITRSLYIDDVLYTISDSMVKMNNLDTLSEINSITLA